MKIKRKKNKLIKITTKHRFVQIGIRFLKVRKLLHGKKRKENK